MRYVELKAVAQLLHERQGLSLPAAKAQLHVHHGLRAALADVAG